MKSSLETKNLKNLTYLLVNAIYCVRCEFMKAANLLELITADLFIKMVTLFNTENNTAAV